MNVWVCRYYCEIPWEHVPYLSASAVVFHYEEALYQVYASLPFTLLPLLFENWKIFAKADKDGAEISALQTIDENYIFLSKPDEERLFLSSLGA